MLDSETITCLICSTLCCLDVGELILMIGLGEERGCGCLWCASVYVGVCDVEVIVSHSKGAIIISLRWVEFCNSTELHVHWRCILHTYLAVTMIVVVMAQIMKIQDALKTPSTLNHHPLHAL